MPQPQRVPGAGVAVGVGVCVGVAVGVGVGVGVQVPFLSATVWFLPAEIVAQSVAPVVSWVGLYLLVVVVPRPSWPCALWPQVHRVPSDLSATVWSLPAAIAVQSVAPVDSWVGVILFVVVPSPSWPRPLLPQAQRVPFDLSATVCRRPAVIAVQLVAPVDSWVGV